jgi:predicted secreted protein
VNKLLTIGSILLCPTGRRARWRAVLPYDGDLERFALGSLQYLRAVCGAKEGQKWRNEMRP